MNTKFFITGCVLAAVSGSAVLFTGCQPEGEPMPPGVYIRPVEKDPERVDIPKQEPVPAAPAAADPVFDPAPAAPVTEAEPSSAEKKDVQASSAAGKKDTGVKKADAAKKEADKKVVPAKKGKAAPRKVAERKEAIKYIVKKNDNLSRIAYTYGLKVSDLKKYNALKKDVIYPKQVLMIPPTGKVTGVSPALEEAKKDSAKKVRKANPLPADGTHTVKARENFTTIARYYGISVGDMIVANPGVNSNRLRIGQKLKIVPGASKKEGASNKTTVAAADKNEEKAPVVKKEKESVKVEKAETSPVEDDLFADIQSPEEAAETKDASGTKEAAEKVSTAKEATAADSAGNETDILKDDDVNAETADKILTTPDGKTKIVIGASTTLKQFAEKYQTTEESLRKENANLPASGELKAGTELNVNNVQ